MPASDTGAGKGGLELFLGWSSCLGCSWNSGSFEGVAGEEWGQAWGMGEAQEN
jgi:hypothetical protein